MRWRLAPGQFPWSSIVRSVKGCRQLRPLGNAHSLGQPPVRWINPPIMFIDFMLLCFCCDGQTHRRVSAMFSSTQAVGLGWRHAATEGSAQPGLAAHRRRGARRPDLRHPRTWLSLGVTLLPYRLAAPFDRSTRTVMRSMS